MVSAQIPGELKFYRISPTNSRTFLHGASLSALGPSGSSDGVIASTPEKWSFIPLQNAPNKVMREGDRLLLTFTPAGAATTDASDCEFSIPITLQDNSITTLGGPDSSVDWDVKVLADKALVAGDEAEVCIKKVTFPFALGSNLSKAFASIENNA